MHKEEPAEGVLGLPAVLCGIPQGQRRARVEKEQLVDQKAKWVGRKREHHDGWDCVPPSPGQCEERNLVRYYQFRMRLEGWVPNSTFLVF